jgi:tRNA (cytidine/uridine-2'-O-)-methyltransferase
VLPGHPHIALFEPEIPQNTGAVARLTAGAGARLHLIPPFGFATGDKQLRRPGLDYWPFVDIEVHDSLEALLALFPGRFAFLSKKAKATANIWDMPDDKQLIIFGRETSGLPAWVHARFAEDFYQIPMYHPGVRSQNLANSVAVVLYDRLRRLREKP